MQPAVRLLERADLSLQCAHHPAARLYAQFYRQTSIPDGVANVCGRAARASVRRVLQPNGLIQHLGWRELRERARANDESLLGISDGRR